VIEREITYHANLPEGFFRISSGMGIHDAKNLLMVPLLHNENVVGVIEIASFKSIDSVAIDFIKQIALGIAVAISTVQENHRNRSILAQANSSIDYTKNDLLRLKNKLDETNIELQEVLGREVEMARFIRAVDSTVLIVEITHTGEIIQVNHYFEVLTGYLSGVVKGSLFTVLLRNLDVLNLFKGNEPVHFPESEVVELLTHDGTVVCILASIVWSTIYQNRAYFVAVDISRIHVKNLKTIQLVSTLKDKQEQVNKRIRALEVENILLKKVKHSEKSLAALVWQQYIVAKFDVDWKFVEANSAFNLFFKVTSSSLISKSILDFFESDHTDRLVILSKSLAAGNYHKETLVVKLFDSSDHKWMRLSYAPVFDIDGLLVNYFVLFEDMDPMVRHENVLSNVISQNEVLAARIVALEIEIQSKGLSVHEDSIKSLNVEVEKIYDLLDLKSAENSDLIKKIDILSSENDNLKLIQAKLATEKNTLNMRLASKQSQLDSELAASALLGSKYDGIVLELENTSAKLTENNKELCRLLDLIHSVSGESVAGSLHSDVIEQKRWLDWYKSQSS
jgi:PAS domain-containing protein